MIAVLNFSASSNKNLSEEESAKEKENGIGKYLVSGEVCVLNMVYIYFLWLIFYALVF